MNRLLAAFALTAASVVASLPFRAEENWPQFRGPTLQGMSDAKDLPVEWGESKNVKWKTPVRGKAWSSPVIWGNQIWLTTATEDARDLSAICIDKESGKVVHDLKLFHVEAPQYIHPFNSPSSPTPAIEEGRVYVTWGSPGTACLDTKTGKILWTRTDFVCNHWRGAGSSPIIYKDLLILPFDGADYQYVVAMNKKTGETVWKTERSVDFKDLDASGKPKMDGDLRKAFSTPRVVEFEKGKPVLISLGSKALYGYEPDTGKELWRIEHHEAHSGSSTPVVGHGMIYLTWGFDRGASLWAVKPGGSGVLGEDHVVWRQRRNPSNKPSVLLADDLLYMIADNGTLSCLDAKTGEDVWRERIPGNYSASPLFANGKVYFFSEDGKTTVIEHGRAFKKLAENDLGDGFMASPAVSGNALYLRSRSHLYRVEKGG